MFFRLLSLIFSLLLAPFLYAEPTFTSLQGQAIPLSTLQGKAIFLHYWASWCDPCIHEIAQLNQFYQRNQEKIALFAVNYDRVSLVEQQQLAKQYHLLYPSLAIDPHKELHRDPPHAVPATFLLTSKGQVLAELYGPQTLASLEKAIRQYFPHIVHSSL